MFRKDRLGRRGREFVFMYFIIHPGFQAYEIKFEKQAECEEAV